MEKIITLAFILFGFTLLGQENNVQKPKSVIIANNQIITKKKLNEFAKKGLIKGLHKGVSKEQRNQYKKKLGDKIGDREFVIKVDLMTKEEIKNRRKAETQNNKKEKVAKKRTDNLKLNVDDPASDFTVKMINGEKITLSDLKGKVVLLNYWATWCTPCLKEFTEFPEKILKPFQDKDFVLIPISRGESKEKVKKKMDKLKKYGVDFNVGIDSKEKIWKKYETKGIPTNYIIDQHGIIKYISTGNSKGSVDKLAKQIKGLLAE